MKMEYWKLLIFIQTDINHPKKQGWTTRERKKTILNNQAMLKSKINSSGQLTHMVAADLFTASKKQVFSAKSGKWLGTIDTYGELNFEPESGEIKEPELQQANPNQTSLF